MGDGPEITSPSDKETKLDNLKPLIRVIDDDYAMRRSWAFLIEGEGWEVVTYSMRSHFSLRTISPARAASCSM